ncbi:MAG: hypothetical protein FWE03_06190 [Firmicutes bacterium]|nr:hypothetical protein [Bacillota bacterium]
MKKRLILIALTIAVFLSSVIILSACDLNIQRFELTTNGAIFNSRTHFESWDGDTNHLNTRQLRTGQTVYVVSDTFLPAIFIFDGWFDGDDFLTRESSFVFTMPNRNVTLMQRWTNLNDNPIIDDPITNSRVPFLQKISSNWGVPNYYWGEFISPRYKHFDNPQYTYGGGPNAQPTDDWTAWWLEPYMHEFYPDCKYYIYFKIGFSHPHTAVTAWIRDIDHQFVLVCQQ